MSKKRTDALKVSANRLDNLIKEYSKNEMSVQLGYEKSWFAQKKREKGYVDIEKEDADKLATIFGCSVENFKISRADACMLKVDADRLEEFLKEYFQNKISVQLDHEESWLARKKGTFNMERDTANKLASILGCAVKDFTMSRANAYTLKVDANRLKKLIQEKNYSQNEISVQLGYERSWLAQKKGCFSMEGNAAANLAAILGCGVEDFKAENEPGISPMIFKMEELLAQKLGKVPTEHLPLDRKSVV